MGFKETLKTELLYQGLLVKELAEKSGVRKRAIDNYLNQQGSLPSADTAVKIARALGVTVEYLVTGEFENLPAAALPYVLDSRLRAHVQTVKSLNEHDRDIIFELSKLMLRGKEPSDLFNAAAETNTMNCFEQPDNVGR
jgi:transcriptional regulator with XRE-family HTH domain